MFTREVTAKYNITRQTINNWIRKGLIKEPKKDKNNKWVWDKSALTELEVLVSSKNYNKEDIHSLHDLNISNRRYLGSKNKLLEYIYSIVLENTEDIESVADLFAGTGVVGDLFRRNGKRVIVNDILYSNYVTYFTWFSDMEVNHKRVYKYIDEFNVTSGKKGYVTKNFGNKYFTIENAMIIDEVRDKIEILKKKINFREYCILLTSLLYATDKVANTVGHYDAYRKKMTNVKKIEFKYPQLENNLDNGIFNMDANELAKKIYADLVYIDTPYNSRGYENTYHLLENIAEWNKSPVEGVARKFIDRGRKKSKYNRKDAPLALLDLVNNLKCRYILLSYNNMAKKGNSRSNAKISNDDILKILKTKGDVKVFSTNHLPFSAGRSEILDHKELLYLCKVRDI